MLPIFLYGTLRHPPLLMLMNGGTMPDLRSARLDDHTVVWAKGESFPLIIEQSGAALGGVLVDATPELKSRMDFYEGAFGYGLRQVRVSSGDGDEVALVYFPPDTGVQPGDAWHLEDWAARWGELSLAAATEVMAQIGQRSAAEVGARFGAIRTRAQARLNAANTSPTALRREAVEGDVEIRAQAQPYARFFAVEDYQLRHRTFDGGMSEVLDRAAFVSGDAVVVLPYDPATDRVLLTEQFRTGPFARGDAQPWSLEGVAGRVDGGESPEDCARREAMEEAGLRLKALIPAPNCYPSPGAKSEFLYNYIGLCDLPQEVQGWGGVATEHEDIRTHIIAFARLMDLIANGEVNNGPLILLALWLEGRRSGLGGGAAEAGG